MDAALPSLHRCTHWHLWGRLPREESSPLRLLGCSYAGTYCWGLLPFICNAHYWKFLSLQWVPKTHDHWLGHVTPGPRAPISQEGGSAPVHGNSKRSPKGPPREGVGHWLLVFPSHSGGTCGRYSPRELRFPWGMRSPEGVRATRILGDFHTVQTGKQAQGHIVCLWQGRIWNLVLFLSQLVAFGQWWKF